MGPALSLVVMDFCRMQDGDAHPTIRYRGWAEAVVTQSSSEMASGRLGTRLLRFVINSTRTVPPMPTNQ